MMVKKYCKKRIPIEAVRWTGFNSEEVEKFCGESVTYDTAHQYMLIHTLEGDMKALVGDYIIKGVRGEFYPCKADIFHETYEECGD